MNKKKQKTLFGWRRPKAGLGFDAGEFFGFAGFSFAYPACRRSHGQKFFASFFQKRRLFLPLAFPFFSFTWTECFLKKRTKKLLAVWMVLGATPALAAPDPFEEANRRVHEFNQTLREQVLAPLAEAWRARVPLDVRVGLGRAAANLAEPITAASGLAAGNTGLAWHALTRFGINSTLGYGGYRDHAAGLGYEPRRFDLADALCAWGVPSGPYLVLPLLGPTTLREAGAAALTAGLLSQGLGADAVLAWNTTSGLLTYAELHPALTHMDAAALDPYATQRSLHAQRRAQTCAEGED